MSDAILDLPAALRYASDEEPGYTRVKRKEQHVICEQDGSLCTDESVLERVEAMVIPPQWSEIWVCRDKNGHLQCTGRDGRRRKQYIYHPEYVAYRQNSKFKKLVAFVEALPNLREHVEQQLRRRNWDRDKMLALMLRMLDVQHLRIGSERYEAENGTYGLTTLRRRHIEDEDRLRLCFSAKSGKFRRVTVKNRRLRKLVREVSDLPGYRLFTYEGDDRKRHSLSSADLNECIRELMGEQFTAKDFRTWAGTSLCVRHYPEVRREWLERKKGKLTTSLVRRVAKDLGNTVSVCREYYIHPNVLHAAREEELPNQQWSGKKDIKLGLADYEQATLELIH